MNPQVTKILESDNAMNDIDVLLSSIDKNKVKFEEIEFLVDVFTSYASAAVPQNEINANEVQKIHASLISFLEIMITSFFKSSSKKQHVVLDHILCCMKTEMLLNRQHATSDKFHFPNQIWIWVVEMFIKNDAIENSSLKKFIDYMKFDDIRFYTCKNIISILKSQSSVATNPAITGNILDLLLACSSEEKEKGEELFLYMEVAICSLTTNLSVITKSMRSVLSNAWLSFLACAKFENVTHKKILINVENHIIPSLTDPKLLIDFLTDSYNMGGVFSLLALNGLFILINEYNLDYPNFYAKLYELLSINIFYAKYKARFFHLLDLFLSSTHLPSYLVMAFIKKMARMTLFAPVIDIDMLLVFIQNLLIRHPSTQILIHQKNTSKCSVNNDPFNYTEQDPVKCCAKESCLWELTSLKMHYSSNTIKLVSSFEKDLPKTERDMSDYLDNEYDTLINKKYELNQKNDVPRNYLIEKEIFSKVDRTLWKIE